MSNIVRFEHLWIGKKCLSVGASRARITGQGEWTTLDIDPSTDPDVLGDISLMRELLPPGTFDFVLASHVLEHILDPFPAVDAIWHVLKPGGRVLIVVPHALSFGYLAPPQHMRPFFPDTFYYFSPDIYENEGTHGTGAYENRQVHPWIFETVEVSSVEEWSWVHRWLPFVFNFAAMHFFNVLQDIYVVMQKPDSFNE